MLTCFSWQFTCRNIGQVNVFFFVDSEDARQLCIQRRLILLLLFTLSVARYEIVDFLKNRLDYKLSIQKASSYHSYLLLGDALLRLLENGLDLLDAEYGVQLLQRLIANLNALNDALLHPLELNVGDEALNIEQLSVRLVQYLLGVLLFPQQK